MLTVKEAQALINQQSKKFGIEIISIHDAYGRVLAEDISADRDYPPFNRAAMDGYAFRAEDFLERGLRKFTVVEEIYAGDVNQKNISEGQCYKIMTGSATPLDADTILRVEDTEQINDEVFFKIDNLNKGQNVAKKGEDKRAGSLVLKANTKLGAIEIASLAVLGESEIRVHRLPEITIISTGNEVVPIEQKVLPHQIRESNSYSLESFFQKYNIKVNQKIIVPDDKEKLSKAIKRYLDSDILILSGGVSMGDADYVPDVLNSVGVEKVFHKIAIKPGKPLWFGASQRGVVFALPGNPMSVQVAFKIFIEPYLRKCFDLPEALSLKLPLVSGRIKKVKFDEYFPCKIEGDEISSLQPVKFNGSGDVASLLNSDGIALQEDYREELKAGDLVKFYFW